MKNDREILEWVLQFAQMDLESPRAGDWLNLQEDLRGLLEWNSFREALTLDGVRAVQREVKEALKEIVNKNAPPGREHQDGTKVHSPLKERQIYRKPQKRTDIQALTFKEGNQEHRYLDIPVKKVEHLYIDFSKPGPLQLRIKADLREELLFLLVSTLSRLEITHLRQCPVCSRLFYAEHGRQLFCSPQCASREGTRRFREKQRVEENERGRANYEKKMKAQTGSNVRSGSRERRTPIREIKED